MAKMLSRFLRYYRPYRGLFFLDLFCAVAAALLELFFPFTVSYMVDTLLPIGDWRLILSACAVLVSIYLVNTGLNYVVHYWGERLGLSIETDLRTELYTHLQKLSFRFFDNHKTGQLASRISNDLLDVGNMAHYGPEHFLIAVFTLIGSIFLMFRAHWQLALVSKGRTTLIIAHRLATVRNADRIVVLTESGIKEQGDHEQLLRQGGLYSRLHRAQAGA